MLPAFAKKVARRPMRPILLYDKTNEAQKKKKAKGGCNLSFEYYRVNNTSVYSVIIYQFSYITQGLLFTRGRPRRLLLLTLVP